MPFESVDKLRSSELFKRMKTLGTLSKRKLSRFVEVFDAVYYRATRGGASEDEAESLAIPLALTAAKKAMAVPAGRGLEAGSHYFAIMAPEMYHSGGGDVRKITSTGLVFPSPDLLDVVMSGNVFTSGHDPTDPQGVIRKIVARSDVPAELRAKIDPDIAVVAIASYFDDVPEDERGSAISPEWLEFRMSGGAALAVPHTFSTVPIPANDEVLGIKRISEPGEPDGPNPYIQPREDSGLEAKMSPKHESKETEAEDEDAVEFDAAAYEAALEERKAENATLKDEIKELKAGLAALVGEKPDEKEFDAKTAIADVGEKVKAFETVANRVEELEASIVKAEADDFAEGLVKAGKIDAESAEKWAGAFIKDRETAEVLAENLAAKTLGEHDVTAVKFMPDEGEAREKASRSFMAALGYETIPEKEGA